MKLCAALAAAALAGGRSASPVFAQELVSPQPSPLAEFGKAVHASGDLLVVGAPGEGQAGGRAFVFRDAGGRWESEGTLVAPGLAAGSAFGAAVATDGQRVVVGAPGPPLATGAAYVFDFDGAAWSLAATLAPSAQEAGDGFGRSVAIDGALVVVGAPTSDHAALDGGAIHSFVEAGGAWSHAGAWAAPDVGLSDGFGWSLSLSGADLAVGAVRDDDGHVNAGAVHLARTGALAGTWLVAGKLIAGQPEAEMYFGTSVSLAGDLLAVGSPNSDQVAPNAGCATVFAASGGSWWEAANLVAPDGASGDAFGISVSIVPGRLLVGASHADVLGGESGKAYVFEAGGVGWSHASTLVPAVGAGGDFFGLAVAATEDFGFVGAFGDDAEGNRAGRVACYDALALTQAWAVPFCFCPQGASCGNLDVDAGCNNSTGRGASLEWWGTPSVAAGDLHVACRRLPPNTVGVLFYGDGTQQLALTDGLVCVGAGPRGVHRTAARSADASGHMPLTSDLVGLASLPLAASGGVAAGETWNFQVWYRDLGSLCGGGSNLSSAVALTFHP